MEDTLYFVISNMMNCCDDIVLKTEDELQKFIYLAIKLHKGNHTICAKREIALKKIFNLKIKRKNFFLESRNSNIDFIINNNVPFEIKFFDGEDKYIKIDTSFDLNPYFTLPSEQKKEGQYFTDFIKILRVLTNINNVNVAYLAHFYQYKNKSSYLFDIISKGIVNDKRGVIVLTEPKFFQKYPIWGAIAYVIVDKSNSSVTIEIDNDFNSLNMLQYNTMIASRSNLFTEDVLFERLNSNFTDCFSNKYKFKISFSEFPSFNHFSGNFFKIEKISA